MNNFKVKTLCTAIAGIGSLGAIGAAEAVYLNPDGLGQVLIYPYYTVNAKAAGAAPFSSLLSVVNSTGSAKAVKVRFIEGRNSQEVLDFNLFLSPKDVWVAGIIPTADGGAGVFTPDSSCTSPVVSKDPLAPTPFVNYLFSGTNDDGAGSGLDRTREGYVEIIEMGNLVGTTAITVTHGVNGAAPECKNLLDVGTNSSKIDNDLYNPNGGLFGGISLVNVLSGEDFTADAVALDEFRSVCRVAVDGGCYDRPGDVKPDLQDADPTATVIYGKQVITTAIAPGGRNVDAVSAVLMHKTVMNEYVLDKGTNSTTDWVMTMPTKRYYYNSDGQVEYLFQRNFGETGACDTASFSIYDREEFQRPGGFSPPPPAGEAPRVCWEATVLSFNNGQALASNNQLTVATTFQNGWASITFNPGVYTQAYIDGGAILYPRYHELPMASATFFGLPVIGFAAQTFQNGAIPGAGGLIQSNYGGNFVHKYQKDINFIN
jgi:hypothetical protein